MRGADAAQSGADAALLVANAVQRRMMRQHQGGGGGNPQVGAKSGFAQSANFLQQCGGRNHHAGADVAPDVLPQRAGGDQVQGGLFAVNHQGVPGVVPALKTGDTSRMGGEQVDNFALSLVAPLQADNRDNAHSARLRMRDGAKIRAGGRINMGEIILVWRTCAIIRAKRVGRAAALPRRKARRGGKSGLQRARTPGNTRAPRGDGKRRRKHTA